VNFPSGTRHYAETHVHFSERFESEMHRRSTKYNQEIPVKLIPASLLISLTMLSLPGRALSFHTAQDSARPRLVLVITVDQMRDDYLDRFADLFCDGGFKRLLVRGARYTHCSYNYSATYTGPGHSVILSGLLPARSGIIANEWFDRSSGNNMYCVQDSSVRSVGIDSGDPSGRMSPLNFLGSTLGDQLREVSPSSRVIGIALKDRGAILPAGKHPTGAYWFDPKSGKWITSTYYRNDLPEWAEHFNALRYPEQMAGSTWIRLLPDSAYLRQGKDDASGEGSIPGETRRYFPHALRLLKKGPSEGRPYDALLSSPAGDSLTEKFAEAAIAGEKLGQRGGPDILAVSFSSLDYCGHIFGPDSHEIEDMIVRLDRQLRSLFDYVDRTVGMQNTVVVLTADHGVCPLPERTGGGAARINGKDFLQFLKVKAGQRFSYDEGAENLLLAMSNNSLYLDTAAIRKRGVSAFVFEQYVIQVAQKAHHIAYAFPIERMSASPSEQAEDSVVQMARNSFYAGRSGDIAVVCSQYSFFSGDTAGTTHGSPFLYDRHVPLILAGPMIKQGVYGAVCTPLDIVPTLAGILRMGVSSEMGGRALTASTIHK
jgi:predicted AlkP superfamily pyrophosphatase or phosphodiesterase